MTRVIVWKELREQGAIVAALLVMGCGLIAGLAAFAYPHQERGFVESLFAASVLGVAEGTIKSRCARGRAAMVPLLGLPTTSHRPVGGAPKEPMASP